MGHNSTGLANIDLEVEIINCRTGRATSWITLKFFRWVGVSVELIAAIEKVEVFEVEISYSIAPPSSVTTWVSTELAMAKKGAHTHTQKNTYWFVDPQCCNTRLGKGNCKKQVISLPFKLIWIDSNCLTCFYMFLRCVWTHFFPSQDMCLRVVCRVHAQHTSLDYTTA